MTDQREFNRRVETCCQRLASTGVAALGALFDLTSPKLVRLAVAITRHQPDAEDAVQATMVRLAVEPRLLVGVATPWAYLLRMVRNEALVIVRRQQRSTMNAGLADLTTYCPVDAAEQEEAKRAVWSALRTLPAEQAEVVVLKVWEQLTFAEIAGVLELSPNTVASRYQYAMSKLAQRLMPQRGEVRND